MRLHPPTLARTLVLSMVVGLTIAIPAQSAIADTAPPTATTPTTVAADALPTVQINGVVWSQAVNGNKVYATGEFTSARPAGAAAGTSETARKNLLAYDITTGNLDTTFNPYLNAPGMVATLSPDKTRLYVGGDFTTADGTSHQRIAVYNTVTGKIINTFAPQVDARVRAIVATKDTVYVGGSFTTANGTPRTKLAAFRASDGALLTWAPTAAGDVFAMVMTPDGSKLIVGGKFTDLNGTAAFGLGALDPVNGATVPWATNQIVKNSGKDAAINSLTADADTIYGTGQVFGANGNLEGTFSANAATGALTWVEDCHGDTYSAYAAASVVYTVSHAHYCGNIGGFPQPEPWVPHRALAFTKSVGGTITHDIYGYHDWYGTPRPTLLHWYPTIDQGTFTGQGQGAWNVTGNSSYVVMGGEFPTVNGKGQQGLVRFAAQPIAPNRLGPQASATLKPSVTSFTTDSARVSFQTTWDYDNEALTYTVVRDGKTATPVFTKTVSSNFWTKPFIGFTDTGLAAGSTHSYRVYVSDPYGNSTSGSSNTGTVATASSTSAYSNGVVADGASAYYRLGEASGQTAYDYAGYADLTLGTAAVRGAAGAIFSDSNRATTLDGTTASAAVVSGTAPAPNTFTTEAWIRTTTATGGKIIGYGNSTAATTASGNYDRQVYMTNSGQLVFGVNPGGLRTLTTAASYNDGQWHHVVATLGATGQYLYVDGRRVGGDTGTTSGQPFTGTWHIGADSLNGWPSAPTSSAFRGDIDDVAIYPGELTQAQVRQHYTASGRTLLGGRPTDGYGSTVYDDNPDSFWRVGEAKGPAADDATPHDLGATYSGGVTYSAPSGVVGSSGPAVLLNGVDGALAAVNAINGPRAYSEELWFSTTTTRGGKLIGFGSARTGASSSYDRHVYMLDNGQLRFGVYTGSTNVIDTRPGYNDGRWHQVVATQDPTVGMRLYVDGQLAGTNPQKGAQDYRGYWRVGGDNTWGGASSNYFAGTIDEVAVYPAALTADQVTRHYAAGTDAVVNAGPVASFTSATAKLAASFDGTASTDRDGTVASYAWGFGDGSTGTGPTPSHTYAAAGTYTVTLTVTDNAGATGVITAPVAVVANAAPTAAFTSLTAKLQASFSGSGSSDSDGTVASYAWDFGDGTTGTGVSPSHTYAAAGSYAVTLTVKDDDGATGTVSQTVTTATNAAPTSSFTSSVSKLQASFDASASADSDGSLATYAWNFGDGTTGTGVGASHGYAAAGTYTVTLTVTDDEGATGTSSGSVVASANAAPTAGFTATPSNLSVALDASGSTDADGRIASYAWDFGDSTTGTGATTSHTYAAAGSYTVTLKATDNDGGVGTKILVVAVTAAPVAPVPFASDAFNRTVSGGFGTADKGGAWTGVGTVANLSVSSGSASFALTAPSAQVGAYLSAVKSTDSSTVVTFSADKAATGGGLYLYAVGRRVSSNNEYRSRVHITSAGRVGVLVSALKGTSSEVALTSEVLIPGTFAPGAQISTRIDVVGKSPTVVRARAWAAGTPEPTTWTVSGTDSTANLQVAGAVGLTAYVSGSATNAPVTIRASQLVVTPTSP